MVGAAKLEKRPIHAVAFNADGKSFFTAGDCHAQFWTTEPRGTSIRCGLKNEPTPLVCLPFVAHFSLRLTECLPSTQRRRRRVACKSTATSATAQAPTPTWPLVSLTRYSQNNNQPHHLPTRVVLLPSRTVGSTATWM